MENQELDFEDKMTQLRLEHEEKLSTMMPGDLRCQLEDTIASLKTQVSDTVSEYSSLVFASQSLSLACLGIGGSQTPVKAVA